MTMNLIITITSLLLATSCANRHSRDAPENNQENIIGVKVTPAGSYYEFVRVIDVQRCQQDEDEIVSRSLPATHDWEDYELGVILKTIPDTYITMTNQNGEVSKIKAYYFPQECDVETGSRTAPQVKPPENWEDYDLGVILKPTPDVDENTKHPEHD